MLRRAWFFVKDKRNLCHLFTGSRMLLVLPAMALITSDNAACVAASIVVVLIAAITDGLDGYCARKFKAVSDFGKIFDIWADVVFVLSLFAALVSIGWVYPSFLYIVLIREVGVAYGRAYAAARNQTIIDAKIWGKAKTVTQFVCIIMVAIAIVAEKNNDGGVLYSFLKVAAQLSLFVSLTMVVYSGSCYLKLFRDRLD